MPRGPACTLPFPGTAQVRTLSPGFLCNLSVLGVLCKDLGELARPLHFLENYLLLYLLPRPACCLPRLDGSAAAAAAG